MGYIKPYWKTVALCCVLVGLLTVFDIARPRIIGDAIDKYITQQSAQDLPPETRFQGILIAAGLYVAILLLQFVCNRLQYLEIRHDPEYIGEWIINRAATIRCYKGSKADRYCQESGFKVEYL